MAIDTINNGESNLSVRLKLNKLVGNDNGSAVSSLPNPIGYDGPGLILNEADGKVYRYVNGGWVVNVEASDIEGQLQNTQIQSLAAPKITGQLTDAQIAAISGSKITGSINGAIVTAASLDVTKFASSIKPVEIVSALPGPPHIQGRIVYLTTDGKLYRNNGSGWVASVAAGDITGTISDAQLAGIAASKITGKLTDEQILEIAAAKIAGQLTSAQIASIEATKIIGTIVTAQIADAALTTAKFASGVRPIEIVATLPTTGNFNGRVVLLTTDGKLYRYYNSQWTAAVPAVDITGQLTNSQLADIAAAKIAGQLTNAQIADIAAAKITGTLVSAQIAALDASKITGQLTDAQIASLSAAKIAGQLTSSQIADIAAAKIVGTLVSSQIADAAITTAKFASGLRPVEVVSTLPTTDNVNGRVVVLTTDGKLYRYNGTAWTASVPAVDVTGQLTNAQLADIAAAKISGQLTNAQLESIDAAKLIGSIVDSQLASISASKITGTVTNAQIAGVAASKVTGQLTNAQIADVAAAKVSGQLTNAQLADIDAAKIVGTLVDAQLAEISTSKLLGQITNVQISDNAISAPKIAALAITSDKLAANSVIAGKVAAGAVTAGTIAADAVTANEIATNAVTAVKINAGAVTTAKIAAGAVTADEIAANAITAAKIEAGAVTTAKIAAGAITANEIAAGAVTAGKIAALSITSAEIAANAIVAGKIAANAVTTASIAAGAITANEIASNAITAVKISAGAITTAKIAAGAITAAEIAAGTITADKFAAGAIEANSISALSITSDKLAANSIITGKIAAGAVTAAEIAAGAITATKLFVGDSSNVYPDAGFNDAAYYTGTFSIGTTTSTGTDRNYLNIVSSASVTTVYSEWFQIEPSAEYYASCAGWRHNGTSGNITIEVELGSIASNGTITFVSKAVLANAVSNTTNTEAGRFSTAFISGSSSKRARFKFQREAGGDASAAFGRPVVRRMANGNLIVDGSIVADKIAANSITTAKIAVGAVTADEIATNAVTTAKISAGAVTANEIAAGAITTQKLAVGSASNLINNTAFWQGLDTWVAIPSGGNTGTASLRPPGQTYASISYPTLMIYQPDAATAGYTDLIWKRAGTADGSGSWADRTVPATPGQRYEFSVQLAGHRCTTELRLYFLLSDGNGSYSTAVSVGPSYPSATDPDSWARSVVRAIAPANTVAVGMHIRKLPTSSGSDSYLFVHKPLLAKCLVNATELTEWSEGGTSIISGGGIATGAIIAQHITANAVTASAIAAGSITTAKLVANAVTANELASNAVTAVKISAGAVSAEKIATDAVTANTIAANAVTTAKIATGAVTANEIAANAITAGKIATNAVTAGTIAAGAVTATEIAADSIAARHLLVADWENLIPDNQLQDSSSWYKSNTVINPASTVAFTSKGMATYTLPSAQTGYEEILRSAVFSVSADQEYLASVQVARTGSNNIAGMLFRIEWLNSNGEPFASSLYKDINTGAITSTSITTYSSTYNPPANSAAARLRIYIQRTGTTAPASLVLGSFNFLRKASGSLIVDGAITASKIQANAITTAAIAAGAVTANEIATNAITAVKISAGAVSTAKIAAGAVTADEIAANAITTAKIAAGAVVSASIAAGEVKASNIAAGAVTAGKIAALSITSAELAANSIIAGKIAAAAVSTTELAANAITTAKIAANAVTANEIAANAVTTAKINTGAVTANEIAADAIVAGKIAANAVTSTTIAANAIIAGKIAADAIVAANIVADTITVNKIYTGAQQYIRNVETLVRFTSAGTTSWVVPANVYYIKVKLWGGGGGGGYNISSVTAQAGGGAGGYAEKVYSVTPGQSVSITVGAAGLGGRVGIIQSAGGNSSVTVSGSTCTANGGTPASLSVVMSPSGYVSTVPGAGGSYANAGFGIDGGAGLFGTWIESVAISGGGGASPMGGQSAIGSIGAGNPGLVPGGGGGGSTHPNYIGGDGARGEVHILY